MFRIVFVLGTLAAMVWFGTQVKLGDLTLYEHLMAIVNSEPSRNLVEGTKGKFTEGVSEVGKLIGDKTSTSTSDDPKGSSKPDKSGDKRGARALAAGEDRPSDDVPEADRKALRKLIESRP
ncbi:MAG: hypothetical protein KA712_01800 [Myxococcales bacterium]|nr:hypothetical protein [Myxococcales bacterium]